jgi:hypothetical protein
MRISLAPEIRKVSTIAEFRSRRTAKVGALIFVLNPEWQRSPLDLGEIQKGGQTIYFVMQKTGGPTLDLCAPFEYGSEGNKFIPGGSVGYHSTFWNTLTERNEPAPDALKATYREVVKIIKKGSRLIDRPKRRYIVAHGARSHRISVCGVIIEPG